ncbi:YOR378W-like protein [Phyllosticta citrichinensis]|uniref:YOR378W-like protein n=1 Tax=Phyllosticta citrichinensis TaxID=1130410 RepID=A0ABR1XNJ7_9PEZI
MSSPEDLEKAQNPASRNSHSSTASGGPATPTSMEEKELSNLGRPSAGDSDVEIGPARESGPDKNHRLSIQSTKPPMGLAHEIAFVVLASSAQLFTQAALAESIAPLNIMSKDFGHPSPGQQSWFTAAHSLTVGTFILIAGRLGDMFGHKKLFVFGWFWFSFWSLISGFTVYSHSQIFLDISRALQGIGPAVLLPSSLALLGQAYPPGRRKEMVFSFFGATAPNGFTLGAVFSGIMAQLAWWPWTFWLMAIFCCVNGVLALFIIPNYFHQDDTASQKDTKQSFDWKGAVTGVLGLVLFNIAWNQAPIVGWSEPYIIVLLILGVLIFVAFLFIECRVDQPLVPVASFDSHVCFVLMCMALGWSSFGIWLYYIWQFTVNLQQNTPLNVAAQLAPTCVAGICAAFTVSKLLSKVPTSFIMMCAMIAFCIGNIIFAVLPVGRLYWKQLFWATLITPWGMDMSFPAATIILSNHVPRRHQGIAASLVTTVVNYSISWGLGIAGTVEVNVNNGGLTDADTLKGYRGAWYAGIGLSGLGAVVALTFIVSSLRHRPSQH